MKNYLNCVKIDTSIKRATTMLIEKAAKIGIYENFGQKEVREIGDKFIDSSSYTSEMNKSRDKLNYFDNWCSSYKGNN